MKNEASEDVEKFKNIYKPSIIDYARKINGQFRAITPQGCFSKTRIDLVDSGTRMELMIEEKEGIKVYNYLLYIGYNEIIAYMDSNQEVDTFEAFCKIVGHEYLHILCGHFEKDKIKSIHNFAQGLYNFTDQSEFYWYKINTESIPSRIFLMPENIENSKKNLKCNGIILNIAGDFEINNILNIGVPFLRASSYGLPEGLLTSEYYSIVYNILNSFPVGEINYKHFVSTGRKTFLSDYYSPSKEKIKNLFLNMSVAHFDIEDFIHFNKNNVSYSQGDGNFVEDPKGDPIYDENLMPVLDKFNKQVLVKWSPNLNDCNGNPLLDKEGKPFANAEGELVFGDNKTPIFDKNIEKIKGDNGKLVLDKDGHIKYGKDGNPIFIKGTIENNFDPGCEFNSSRDAKKKEFTDKQVFSNLQGNIPSYAQKMNIAQTGIWKEFKDLLAELIKIQQNMKVSLVEKIDNWCKFNNRKDSSLMYPGKHEVKGAIERKIETKPVLFIDISGSMADVIEPLFTFCYFVLSKIDIELVFYDTEIQYIYKNSKEIKLEPFVCGGTNALNAIKQYEQKYQPPKVIFILSDCFDYTLSEIIKKYNAKVWKINKTHISRYKEE